MSAAAALTMDEGAELEGRKRRRCVVEPRRAIAWLVPAVRGVPAASAHRTPSPNTHCLHGDWAIRPLHCSFMGGAAGLRLGGCWGPRPGPAMPTWMPSSPHPNPQASRPRA
jgi:hypothetical protein